MSQTIISASERGGPGDTINIVGADFDTSCLPQVTIVNVDGTPGQTVALPVKTQTSSLIQATIPLTIAGRLWRVGIKTPTKVISGPLINQPVIYSRDQLEMVCGSAIRIFGKNLVPWNYYGAVPYVRFVDPSGGSHPGQVLASDPTSATIGVPTGLAEGVSYTLKYSNGLGGTVGEATTADSIRVHHKASDPFNLGYYYGNDFGFAQNIYNAKTDPRLTVHVKGDGTTSDLAALNTILSQVVIAGGGTVYLPAGTYSLGGGSVDIHGQTVIMGDGVGKTILKVGNYIAGANPGTAMILFQGGANCGLYNLSVVNTTNGSSHYTCVYLQGNDRCFVKNVSVQGYDSQPLGVDASTNCYIASCSLNGSGTTASSNVHQSTYIAYRQNSVLHKFTRDSFNFCANCLIEGNSFAWDTSGMGTQSAPESGGVELSWNRNITFRGNAVTATGPYPVKTGCGEMVLTQNSVYNDYTDMGTATSATATTISDTTKSWPSNFLSSYIPASFQRADQIAIVTGRGMGQVRSIVSATPTTITIDKPWTVVPDNTSGYTIGTPTAVNYIYSGNRVTGGCAGLDFYNGGMNCVVEYNTVTDAFGILVRGSDDIGNFNGTGVIRRHNISWNNWVTGNTVRNTTGKNPAVISVAAELGNSAGFGLIQFANDIRKNTVYGNGTFAQYPINFAHSDGIWCTTDVYSSVNYGPCSYSNVGTIFSGNTGSGCSQLINLSGVQSISASN